MLNINVLKSIVRCASNDDTRQYLKGVQVKYKEIAGVPHVIYNATDGHVLGQVCIMVDESLTKLPEVAVSLGYLRRNGDDGIIISRKFITKLDRVKSSMFILQHALFTDEGLLSVPDSECTYNRKAYFIDVVFPQVNKVIPNIKEDTKVHSICVDVSILDRLGRALHGCAKELSYGQKHLGVEMTFEDKHMPIQVHLNVLKPNGDDEAGTFVRGVVMGMRL